MGEDPNESWEILPVNEWTFGDDATGKWTLDQISRESIGPRGAVFRTGGKDSKLIRSVSIFAKDVDVFELEAVHLTGGVELFWAGPGENFSPERQLTVLLNSSPPDIIRFKVAQHPRWRGEITRLRLDPSNWKGHRMELGVLRAGRKKVSSEGLKALSSRAWKITLDDEVRTAYLVVPGAPLRREIELRVGERIHFGFGLQGGVEGRIEMRASLLDAAGSAHVLMSQVFEPGQPGRYEWHDHEVEFVRSGRFALVLSAHTETTINPARGLPVWEAPRILRRRGGPDDLNVILISVDTLRADHLSLYGYERRTSPNLEERVAESGVVFQTVVAAAPWTLPSHVSMLTGLDALHHGVNHDTVLEGTATVAGLLAEAGYTTVAVTGGGFLHPNYGFHWGFDSYRHWPAKDREKELEFGTGTLIQWLERNTDRRFFAFFHTYEVHTPYRPRQPFFSQFRGSQARTFGGDIDVTHLDPLPENGFKARSGLQVRDGGGARPLEDEEIPLAVDCYDAGIAFMDAQLGILFDYLDRTGLAESTAVIITSDHGEAFGEHGLMGHQALYDENLLVPLVVIAPGVKAGHRVEEQVRSVDIAPTILDLAGLSPGDRRDGVSLKKALTGGSFEVPPLAWAYASGTNRGMAIRSAGNYKYIFDNTAWCPEGNREEFYVLSSDAGEASDRSSKSERTGPMREMVIRELDLGGRGLRLEVHNGERRNLGGQFVFSQDVSQMRFKVKSVVPPGASLVQRGSRGLLFDVPPDTVLRATVESLEVSGLKIVGDTSDPVTAGMQAEIALGDHKRTWVFVLGSQGWQAGDRIPGSGSWIVVEWQNESHISRPAGDEDGQLRQQLQALGYVE